MVSAAIEKPTVTVVDDEPYALDVLCRAARSWNYQTQAAASAEEALALLERQLTPVVVTDLRMPGRGGVWLVREIQRRWPEVSIIVVTAGHEMDTLAQCLDAGAHHYFLKPINFDEFHHALEATARHHLKQREQKHVRRRLESTIVQQTRKIRRTFLSAIDSMVRLLEARDPYTSGHSLRVSAYVVRMGRMLQMDPRSIQRLHVAAKLHDIGKVGLPEAILNKPGKLTAEEYTQVRNHPVIGQRILSPILRNREILAAVRGHHERFDGLGYPDNLRGGNIPLAARILAIADCFDALTSSRAYRAALPRSEAVAILRDGAGSQFDPTLVPLFVRVVEGD